jgi:hypothetical protein
LKLRVSVKNPILGMVKSDLDALAPCALKSCGFFWLEMILVNRNSIEKQVAKQSKNDGFAAHQKHTRVS